MKDIPHILAQFPHLSAEQADAFRRLLELYPQWNEKINVVSRKDIDNLEVNHLLHSLAIAKLIEFKPGSRVVDLGCGGGLPGIPLAIFFPDVHFHLIDRVGKKITVAQSIADELGLRNVTTQHGDSGECREKFDFVVSRAVMPMPDLLKASRHLIAPEQRNALPNGIIALKGGDLQAELSQLQGRCEIVDIPDYFPEEFFKTKKIVYLPVKPQ